MIYCAITLLGGQVLVFLLVRVVKSMSASLKKKNVADSSLYEQICSTWHCATSTRKSNHLQLSKKGKGILSAVITF